MGKKTISILLAALMVFSLFIFTPITSGYAESDPASLSPPSPIIIGDTDRDENVTLIDATLIEYYLVALSGYASDNTLSDEQLRITDVDEDLELTIVDATAIQRYCLDIDTFNIIGKSIMFPEHIYPTSITLNKSEIVLTEGQTYKLNDALEPYFVTEDTVTWSSDNPEVAEIDNETGVIEAVSRGSSSIKAETVNGLTADCKVWVTHTDEEDIDEFGDGNINNYTNNYYNIDYNVTVNPTITTDTNNFLASTGDTTDRSGDIAAMLKKTGCCILGSGEFFIKGVDMPDNTMIRGQGNSTHVYWIDENDSPKYIFKLGSSCSLSDMWITQYKRRGSDPPVEVQSDIRDFSAIEFSGVFTEENPVNGPFSSTLSNLRITDVKGSGIKLSRTGTAVTAHVAAVNCYMLRCDCGIYGDVISEFHQFTNTSCNRCYYGVICRGGNNTFNNCNFSSNYVGIYLDNSVGQSYNNGHGIFNACVIDHSKPNNTGTALLCDGISTGMKFVACTFGYGNIQIKNSDGIRFYDSGMGFMDVSIENSTGTIFSNLGLRSKSDFSLSETNSKNTRFTNCFYRDGTEFVR